MRYVIDDFAPDGCEKWWFDKISELQGKTSIDIDSETGIAEAIKSMKEAGCKESEISRKNLFFKISKEFPKPCF